MAFMKFGDSVLVKSKGQFKLIRRGDSFIVVGPNVHEEVSSESEGLGLLDQLAGEQSQDQ